MNHPFRLDVLGVLGSGKGYNVVAMTEACAAGKIPAQAASVLSGVEGAGILGQASERSF
jgi:folate-dependent phosphoribosylglycinamide formyltransferase PurN